MNSSAGKRFVNWAKDFAVSTVILLFIAYVFERITSTESLGWALQGAITLQRELADSISHLNPAHLFTYLIDTFEFIAQSLTHAPSWIVAFVFPLRLIIGLLSLVALPIAVFVEGNPFEWVLIAGVYLPAYFWLKRAAGNDPDRIPGMSLVYAFGITVVFYWFAELLLLGALALFQSFIGLAQLAVGGSVVASSLYWIAGKRGEHSVTERMIAIISRTRDA